MNRIIVSIEAFLLETHNLNPNPSISKTSLQCNHSSGTIDFQSYTFSSLYGTIAYHRLQAAQNNHNLPANMSPEITIGHP